MPLRSLLLPAGLVLACTIGSAPAMAQTLYKLIDKNGKVTYSESRPKEWEGQVVPMNIDPNANTATLPKLAPTADPRAPQESGSDRAAPRPPTAEQKLEAARDRLAAAKKALQDAMDNPREGDIIRIGTKGGFTRPVPSEDYQKRLTELEERVKRAEEELKVAEGR